MFISSSGMPQLVKCKISGRYVPISPSYDPNEFVHFYNKKSHQKIMTFITIFLSLFFRSLVFFFKKLRNQSTLSTIPKRKFKNSSIRTRTGRPKFDYFSSNFSKNLSISMRYTTLPQVGVFMAELIWANDVCNAKFDWFSRKETKSTYEKRPFSTRETRFPHNIMSKWYL